MPCNADSPRCTTMRHHVSGLPFPCWIRRDATYESGRVRLNPSLKSILACGRYAAWTGAHRIRGSPLVAFVPSLSSLSPINDFGLVPSCRARRPSSWFPSPGAFVQHHPPICLSPLGDNSCSWKISALKILNPQLSPLDTAREKPPPKPLVPTPLS
jgi:hypothetical protein